LPSRMLRLSQPRSAIIDWIRPSCGSGLPAVRPPLSFRPRAMTDPRYSKLAKLLIQYSTALKRGDHVFLDLIDVPDEFGIELARAARAAGAPPILEARHTRLQRELLLHTDQKHAALSRDLELFRMKRMQAYIAIRGSANVNENSDVPSERMALFSRITRPVL